MILIEEYRGYESSLVLESGGSVDRGKLFHENTNYDGTYIRFSMLNWIQSCVEDLCSHPSKEFDAYR